MDIDKHSLKEKDIWKFMQIYKNKFGIDLTEKEAKEKAISLLSFMKVVYRPIKKENLERLIVYDQK